jgi:hypothetical protein
MMNNGFLKFNQELLDEYEIVVKNVLTARNLLVRISITDEIESSVRFKTYLDTAKEKEIAILFKVLAELEEN